MTNLSTACSDGFYFYLLCTWTQLANSSTVCPITVESKSWEFLNSHTGCKFLPWWLRKHHLLVKTVWDDQKLQNNRALSWHCFVETPGSLSGSKDGVLVCQLVCPPFCSRQKLLDSLALSSHGQRKSPTDFSFCRDEVYVFGFKILISSVLCFMAKYLQVMTFPSAAVLCIN